MRRCGFVPAVLVLCIAFLFAAGASGQGAPDARERAVGVLAQKAQARKAEALSMARRGGWAVRGQARDATFELIAVLHGRPVYLITANHEAAISSAAEPLRNGTPYGVNGTGLTVGVWDAGSARTTHQELTGRVTAMDGASANDHSTHVAGTIAASGIQPNAMGMAPSALIDAYDWNSDAAEMAARGASAPAQAGKIYLSNHSYVIIVGWAYGNFAGPTGWYWFGTWGQREAGGFGQYDADSVDWDTICYQAPYYLPFKAAGNDRSDSAPAAGTTFRYWDGSSWKTKTYDPATDPYSDGYDAGGFDTIPTFGCAKNIMTVGAVGDAVLNGGRSPASAAMTTFSGWGPADDGRVKPDIVANGVNLYSPLATNDTSYANYSGTSMATPNAAGSAALLIDLYGRLFPGSAMRAGTLKGLIIHTADNLGNPGPDYVYGWGLMNAQAAADHIRRHAQDTSGRLIVEDALTGAAPSRSYAFTWDGSSPIRATLCWTDPPGSALTGLDNTSPRLVNDLDLRLVSPGGAVTYNPYVLDPANPANAATTGDNVRDNVEQVYVAAPTTAGQYTVQVTHKGTLTDGQQNFSLLISGGAPSLASPVLLPEPATTPGTSNTIDWEAASGAADYYAEYDTGGVFPSPDGNSGWTAALSHEFTGLATGQTYYYHVRGRRLVPGWGGSWRQTSQAEFQSDALSSVSVTPQGDVILGNSGSPVAETLGGTTNAYSGSSLVRFNAFSCTTSATLTKIEAYLNISSSTELQFAVYESTSSEGTYLAIYNGVVASSGTGQKFYSSAPISVSMVAGRYYAIAAGWLGTAGYYTSTNNPALAFGTAFVSAGLVYPPSTVGFIGTGMGTNSARYYHRLTSVPATYAASGTVTTANIAPGDLAAWRTLTYLGVIPAGTSLSVDVLDGSGSLLAAGVASGTDLSTLGITANPIRLRGNLGTASGTVTPTLRNWAVAWKEPDPTVQSAWSNVEHSTQQALTQTLSVQSEPVSGVSVTGAPPGLGGTTPYSRSVNIGDGVGLTAPMSVEDTGIYYTLLHWALNAAPQPDRQAALSFTVSGDPTAVAVYELTHHTGDYWPAAGVPGPGNREFDFVIDFHELLRLIQLYNAGALHTDASSEDGYAPGAGAHGVPHSSDYWPPSGTPGPGNRVQDWTLDFHELLRFIQFYNSPGYHVDPTSEDGFAPDAAPGGAAAKVQAAAAVAATDVTGTRSVPGNQYTPGGQVTVSVHVEHAGDLLALGVVETPPAGWTLASVGGDDAPAITPAAGSVGPLSFAWLTPPASPVDFSYVLNVPASATGQKTISGTIYYRKAAGELQAPIPDTVLAQAVVNQPPVADAGRDQKAKARQSVSFNGRGSYDPDGRIVLYEWDLDGDGLYEMTGMKATHVYDSAGVYIAVLRVTDNGAATDTDACVITVTASPGKGPAR